MNRLQEKINQFKELLNELSQELAPYWDNEIYKEKQSQLKSIEKSISHLKKSKTTIPDELRRLKFKLLKDLDAFKQAESVTTEIQNFFAQNFPTIRHSKGHKRNTSRETSSGSRITIKELVDARILSAPMELTRKYKGSNYKARVTAEGTIEMTVDGKLEIFDSPSAAAIAASGKSQNGWKWWSIVGQPKKVTLDAYRQKLKEHEA